MSTTNEQTNPQWSKSTFSATGDCVEWSLNRDGQCVMVRDSKDPDGGQLQFTLSEWRAFLQGVKHGEAHF